MTANVTQTEWDEAIQLMATKTLQRWPWIKVDARKGEIHLSTEVCSATLDIRIAREKDNLWMEPTPRFGSGTSLMGELSTVERGLFEYRGVLDALHFLVSEAGDVRIHPDGKCPCDSCGATGKVRGVECSRCEGKSVR